jgi:hypothetical protein
LPAGGEPVLRLRSRPTCRAAALFAGIAALLTGWGAGPRPAAGEGEPRALDAFFKGQVVALTKDKVVTLRYDFSSKEQLADWKQGVPWPIAQEPGETMGWFDDRLEVKGSTGARHLAEWSGDIWVTATLTLDGDRDLGGFLIPADEGDSYAAFTLGEAYFHAWDKKAGGTHSIIKFGKQWQETGGDFIGFRYVSGRPPPAPIKPGDTVSFAFGIEKGKLGLNAGDLNLRGADPSPAGKRFKQHRPGFYAIKGRMLVDNVTITGRLSEEWLAAEKVALRTEKPLGEAAGGGLDPAVQALVAGYAAGTSPLADLVKGIADAGAPKAARDALAEAVSAGPRKAVNGVLDLLYSPDVESRAYGAGIVKRLLGKDYGYQPKAGEEQRRDAIRRLNEDIRKNPALLNGP